MDGSEEIKELNILNEGLVDCKQTARPVSNIIHSLVWMQKNADITLFEFLFKDKAQLYFKKYRGFMEKNLLNFIDSLNGEQLGRLSQYVENSAIKFDYGKLIAKCDMDRMMSCDPNILPSIVRDLNYSKYGGAIHENELIRWVVLSRVNNNRSKK